jgi:hypothetical protein
MFGTKRYWTRNEIDQFFENLRISDALNFREMQNVALFANYTMHGIPPCGERHIYWEPCVSPKGETVYKISSQFLKTNGELDD